MSAELRLEWPQVLAWRMKRSNLTSPSNFGITGVAEQLVGVQAQVMSSAEIALSLRSKSVRPENVRDALWRDRTIVKTWTARGTLHLVTPDDLALFVGVMKLRGEYWAKPSWEKFHGVSAKEMTTILEGLPEALGDACLTREELAASLGKVTHKPKIAQKIMSSWGATIKPAAFRGELCFGPNRGRYVTFASPHIWIHNWQEVDGDEALKELVFRYVDTYGPATLEDFTRWLGVEPKIARAAFRLVKDELIEVDVEGTSSFLTAFGAEEITKRTGKQSVHLLPAFDPYVVGVLKNLQPLLPHPSLRSRISRTAGWISPTVVVDGQIVGIWSSLRRGKSLEINVEFLTDVDSAVERAVDVRLEKMTSLMKSVPEKDIGTSSGDVA